MDDIQKINLDSKNICKNNNEFDFLSLNYGYDIIHYNEIEEWPSQFYYSIDFENFNTLFNDITLF
jgi:hypothetical protein